MRLENILLADRLHRAVVIPQPAAVARVEHIGDIMSLGGLLSVVVDDCKEAVGSLLLGGLLRSKDLCEIVKWMMESGLERVDFDILASIFSSTGNSTFLVIFVHPSDR